MELWEPCEDFPDFGVSDLGHIEDIEKHRIVPTRFNHQNIRMVTVKDPMGNQFTRSVALLVAKAFVPQSHAYFDSVIHLNGDRADCQSMNLMWRSRPFALRYHAMFNEPPYRVSVYIPALDEFYPSLREACTTYGLVESLTYQNLFNRQSCFPYSWSMEEVTE